jgi:hypothetical protein
MSQPYSDESWRGGDKQWEGNTEAQGGALARDIDWGWVAHKA